MFQRSHRKNCVSPESFALKARVVRLLLFTDHGPRLEKEIQHSKIVLKGASLDDTRRCIETANFSQLSETLPPLNSLIRPFRGAISAAKACQVLFVQSSVQFMLRFRFWDCATLAAGYFS